VFNEYGVQITSPHYMMDPKDRSGAEGEVVRAARQAAVGKQRTDSRLIGTRGTDEAA
jgi:hypothetical protein